MPLDYYVWAVVGRDRAFVLDTGFSAEMGEKRGRRHLRDPGDGLKSIGIDPAAVEDVVVSHMHYDHIGNHEPFPNARYHVQDKEMRYATGRNMCHTKSEERRVGTEGVNTFRYRWSPYP